MKMYIYPRVSTGIITKLGKHEIKAKSGEPILVDKEIGEKLIKQCGHSWRKPTAKEQKALTQEKE